MKLWALLFILATGLGCRKDPGENDNQLPVISLASPANGQNFPNGTAITITGTITDNKFIAEAHIHVSNTNTGALLMDVHLFPNGPSTSFNQSFVAASGTNYKIQVIAKDRAVNEARVSVDVSCN